MGQLLDLIRDAARNDAVIVSWHADERCEERGVSEWQLVADLDQAVLVEERPDSAPNPTVIVRQLLANGEGVEVVWAWMPIRHRAKLVTVYFPE